jgi:outer membrane protein TolC
MFKRTLLLVLGLVQIATATSLENILKLVETKNYILKAKETKIRSSKIDADLSNTWSNPVFSIGVTDINLNDPISRDIEAMQTQYITYNQVIPTNGKLKLSNDIKRHDTKVNQLEYNNYKQKLKSEVISYSYTLIFQQEKVKILNKYLKNLTQQKKLLNLLYENGKMDQSSLVNIDIKIYKLKLQKQKLDYQISKIKNDLEKIVYEKINTIELPQSIHSLKSNVHNDMESHPMILMIKQRIQQQNQRIQLENSKKISDVKFTLGYYQREIFDDYISFNISIPLGMQGREKLKIQQSKINKESINESLKSLKQELKITIEDLEKKVKVMKQNYELIDNKMIPLNELLEQSHQIHLSANTMESLSVYESINSKYDLMILSKNEKISYFDALSKLLYFKGQL